MRPRSRYGNKPSQHIKVSLPSCVLLKLSVAYMFSNLCYKYLSKEQIPQVDIAHSNRLMLNRTNEAGAQQINKSAHTDNSYDTHI